MSTVIPGTKEDTKTDTKRKSGRGWERKKTGGDIKKSDRPFKWSRGGPLEYLMDAMASRNDEDPYHILLLDKTFEEPRITVDYVSSSLTVCLCTVLLYPQYYIKNFLVYFVHLYVVCAWHPQC